MNEIYDLGFSLTRRYLSKAPFSMYSVTIMACLTEGPTDIHTSLVTASATPKNKFQKELFEKDRTHKSSYIWWPLPLGGWCSDERTGPWWKPRSESPAAAFPCNPASVSWLPRQTPSSRAPLEYHGTPPQTPLRKNINGDWFKKGEADVSDVFDKFSQISSCRAFGVHRMKLS